MRGWDSPKGFGFRLNELAIAWKPDVVVQDLGRSASRYGHRKKFRFTLLELSLCLQQKLPYQIFISFHHSPPVTISKADPVKELVVISYHSPSAFLSCP